MPRHLRHLLGCTPGIGLASQGDASARGQPPLRHVQHRGIAPQGFVVPDARLGQRVETVVRSAIAPGQPPAYGREESADERVWRQVTASPRAALNHELSPADLQTLLLDVSRRRASRVTPARLLQRWRQDRYVRPTAADPRVLWPLEARLWAMLPPEFAGLELSPVAPLGACCALGPVSQDRVISTVRGSEVVSDQTNVLALEAAVRRKEGRRSAGTAVHLASCHRVLRGQPFDAPGLYQHFRLFALVSSARDQGSGTTEAELLTAHLKFWSDALSDLLPHRRASVQWTVFGFPPLRERMSDTVLPAVTPLPDGITQDQVDRGAVILHLQLTLHTPQSAPSGSWYGPVSCAVDDHRRLSCQVMIFSALNTNGNLQPGVADYLVVATVADGTTP